MLCVTNSEFEFSLSRRMVEESVVHFVRVLAVEQTTWFNSPVGVLGFRVVHSTLGQADQSSQTRASQKKVTAPPLLAENSQRNPTTSQPTLAKPTLAQMRFFVVL